MEDFVSFELAVKLKEKGFTCKYPFAMYDEDGDFYPLFTSCDEDEDSKCIFGNRMYYDYDDFIGDKDAIIAPTISQVLKWLRKEKKLHIEPCILASTDIDADGEVINEFTYWSFRIMSIVTGDMIHFEYKHIDDKRFDSYEQAAIAGIEYVHDNLI